jgi:hypothetical protein
MESMQPETILSTVLSVAAALGLAAACGFRVFVPMLVVSIAAKAEMLGLSEGFAWIGTTPALICFAVATAVEIAAYYVPVVDNFLDTISTPAAIVAGVVVAAAVIVDMDPWLRWTLAVVAGGGAAAAVKLPMIFTRGTSTVSTAGTANPVVSTTELVAASSVSAAAVLWPVAIPFVVLAVVWFFYRRLRRREAPSS